MSPARATREAAAPGTRSTSGWGRAVPRTAATSREEATARKASAMRAGRAGPPPSTGASGGRTSREAEGLWRAPRERRAGGNGGGAIRIRANGSSSPAPSPPLELPHRRREAAAARAGAFGSSARRFRESEGSRPAGAPRRPGGGASPGEAAAGALPSTTGAHRPSSNFARVTARGGALAGGGAEAAGGAGTIFLRVGGGLGELVIDNGGVSQVEPRTVLAGIGEGTVADLGDDYLVKLEGDFPEAPAGNLSSTPTPMTASST